MLLEGDIAFEKSNLISSEKFRKKAELIHRKRENYGKLTSASIDNCGYSNILLCYTFSFADFCFYCVFNCFY